MSWRWGFGFGDVWFVSFGEGLMTEFSAASGGGRAGKLQTGVIGDGEGSGGIQSTILGRFDGF